MRQNRGAFGQGDPVVPWPANFSTLVISSTRSFSIMAIPLGCGPWWTRPILRPGWPGTGVLRLSRRAGEPKRRAWSRAGLRERGAALRPDERPDVGRRAPALEERAGRRAEPAAGREVPGRGGRHRRHRLPDRAPVRASGRTSSVCDINAAMLAVGRDRAVDRGLLKGLTWTTGDAENLPFPDRSFDAYTIAFGLRNVTDIDKALGEAHRVLKPGGRFYCLEFSKVTSAPIGRVYDAYSSRALPFFGRIVARDAESYRYLHESIRRFPPQRELARRMREVGLRQRRLARHDAGRRGAALGLAHLRIMFRALRQFLAPAAHGAELGAARRAVPAGDPGHRAGAGRLGAAVRAAPRCAPAGRAAGGGAAGDGPVLHQARPGAVDARRSFERAGRGRSRRSCRTTCRPSPAPRRGASSRPSSASRSTRCSPASTTRRSPPPRSPRCISPSPPTAARSRSRCCGRASSSPSSATSTSSTGWPSWSSAPSRATAA